MAAPRTPVVLNYPVYPALGPANGHATATPHIQAAFNAAVPFVPHFPVGHQQVNVARLQDPQAFGETTVAAPRTVALNYSAHGGAMGSAQLQAETSQTALHELHLHARHDAASDSRGAAIEAASTQHRRMFIPRERSKPESYLEATRGMLRADPTPAHQAARIANWHADVMAEIDDPANQRRMTHQGIRGAREWADNRRLSMSDAVSPMPAQLHTW